MRRSPVRDGPRRTNVGCMNPLEWTAADAADWIRRPLPGDDKYSRGVLGVVTGSAEYPGAAVLGVEAALHTGLGMVRYLGPAAPTHLVLARRPEVVTVPGRVQAWLLGSGMDAKSRDAATTARFEHAIAQELPTVLDAGALDVLSEVTGPVVITPHLGELARVLGVDRAEIAADAPGWAGRAAAELGVTVLLKGAATYVAEPGGTLLVARSDNGWMATAGSGDALGGILGALVAGSVDRIVGDPTALARLAATASVIHSRAADLAGAGGPFVVLDLATAVARVVARLVAPGR